MEHYKVSALARDKRGKEGILTILISERDAETTPREEMALQLMLAASKKNLTLLGEMKVEQA